MRTAKEAPPVDPSGSVSRAAAPAPPPHCLDCGEALHGEFCSRCGQRERPAVAPLRALVEEVAADYLTLDNRLFRTLRPLLLRPGLLTNEYLAGRRTRYVPPFRLYIAISVLHFVVLALSGATRFFFFQASGGDFEFASFVRLLPRLMFLLLPVFALLLHALYRSRLYAEHLIFALHYHAFAFLVLSVDAVMQAIARPSLLAVESGAAEGMSTVAILAATVAGLAQGWVIVYLVVALRRVYGGGLIRSTVKGLALMTAYMVVLGTVGMLSIPGLRTLIITMLRTL
jgi:hypothetical protein